MYSIPLVGRRRPAANSAENEPLLASLSQNHTSLSSRAILKLSETSSFAKHWREIARHLDLSEAEIEQCEGRGGSDQEEICLQVLQCCSNKHGSLTVASLTKAIVKGRLHSSLQILHSVVSTC